MNARMRRRSHRECPMEARLFVNAGTSLVGLVNRKAKKMSKFENSIAPTALSYAPTRTRRKTAPSQPAILPPIRSATFQLRIDIPPSTSSNFSWAGPGKTEGAKFLNLGRDPAQKSLFKATTVSSGEKKPLFKAATVSSREMKLVRRIVSLPEGDKRAFADGRQLYDISGYPLVPVCAELDNRDWDLSAFDTSNCCDHADHQLAMKKKQNVSSTQNPPATHTSSVSNNLTLSPHPLESGWSE